MPADMTYEEWGKKFVESNLQMDNSVQYIKAFDEQTNMLKKYGNISSLMLNGTSEELIKWSELQKLTNKDDKSILRELSKNCKDWETVLELQTEESIQPLVDRLLNVATDEELAVLNLWSGETYANINRHLRFGEYCLLFRQGYG